MNIFTARAQIIPDIQKLLQALLTACPKSSEARRIKGFKTERTYLLRDGLEALIQHSKANLLLKFKSQICRCGLFGRAYCKVFPQIAYIASVNLSFQRFLKGTSVVAELNEILFVEFL